MNHAEARGDAGFTLLELLVVTAILGILAGVLLPSLTFRRSDLGLARAQMQSMIRYLRGEAMAGGQIYRLRLEPETGLCFAEVLGEKNQFEPVQDSLAEPRRLAVDRITGVKSAGGSRWAIQVFPGGSVEPALVAVEIDGQPATLAVHALTGAVEAKP